MAIREVRKREDGRIEIHHQPNPVADGVICLTAREALALAYKLLALTYDESLRPSKRSSQSD